MVTREVTPCGTSPRMETIRSAGKSLFEVVVTYCVALANLAFEFSLEELVSLKYLR